MLVGRGEECQRLHEALSSARDGVGAALVLVGDPGIGKTTLLGWLRDHATEERALEMRGVESDSELPYADLVDLLAPVVDHLDALAPTQADTLASALGLGPPRPVDGFSVGVAVLALLVVAAEARPLVLLVDDLQWIDSASREALSFVSRRVASAPILLVAAQRAETSEDVRGLPRAESIRVGPLGVDDAALVLGQTAEAIAPAIAERLLEAARGNPLALVELPHLLTSGQLAGTEALVEPLPTGNGLERAFAARLAPLSPSGRLAILVAAADSSGSVGVALAACRAADLDERALGEAEALGLIQLEGNSLVFRHPLVRSAAYHGASAVDRRRVHAALAATDTDVDRQAWHGAAAAIGPDEAIADELDYAGTRALARGAFASGAAALERAASLTVGDELRGARLLRAATAMDEAGNLLRSDALAREAAQLVEQPLLHARLAMLRGRLLMAGGRVEEGYSMLLGEADLVASLDPEFAATMISFAANLRFFRLEAAAAIELTERASKLGDAGRPRSPTERGAAAMAKTMAGDRAGPPLLLELARDAAQDMAAGHRLGAALGWPLVWVEEYEAARTLLTGSVEVERSGGSLRHLPQSLSELAELDFRVGRWVSALAGAYEAMALFEETGQQTELAFVASTMARVEAALGREADCRRHVGEGIAADAARGLLLTSAYAGAALGLLELGRGDPEAAIVALEPVEKIMRDGGVGEPWLVQWAPDLIEAYSRAGRGDRAVAVLDRFEEQARATGRVSALAAAARCRGLLALDGTYEESFATALALHERVPTPFERARTELAFGERLRRGGQRSEARARLGAALQTFQGLGAEPWSERVRVELRASGQSVRTPEQRAEDALTPQELQVGALVAGGATNRETAATLYLSVKTIEFHLGNVYRKLGIRSRTELARALNAPA